MYTHIYINREREREIHTCIHTYIYTHTYTDGQVLQHRVWLAAGG